MIPSILFYVQPSVELLWPTTSLVFKPSPRPASFEIRLTLLLSLSYILRYFTEIYYLNIFNVLLKWDGKVSSQCKILSSRYFTKVISVKQQLRSTDDYFIKFIFIHSLVIISVIGLSVKFSITQIVCPHMTKVNYLWRFNWCAVIFVYYLSTVRVVSWLLLFRLCFQP